MAEQPRHGHGPDDDITLAAALRDLAGHGQGLAAPVPAAEITERGDRTRRRRFAVLAAAAVVVFGGVSGALVGVADPREESVRPAGRTEGPAPAPSSGDSPGPTTAPSTTVPVSSPPPTLPPPPSGSASGAPPPTADAHTSDAGPPPTRTYAPTRAPSTSSG